MSNTAGAGMRLAVKITLSALVLLGAMYLFAFPARSYLAQKTDIAAQERTIAVLKAENAKLAAESSALQNDATIEQIARQEYGLVMPGQRAFMVLPSSVQAVRSEPSKPRDRPWYSSLEFWHHL